MSYGQIPDYSLPWYANPKYPFAWVIGAVGFSLLCLLVLVASFYLTCLDFIQGFQKRP